MKNQKNFFKILVFGFCLVFAFFLAAAFKNGKNWLAAGVTYYCGNSQLCTTTPNTTDGAEFVSQSVPASMTAGETRQITVAMKNTGTSAWTEAAGYRLGSQNPQDNDVWVSGHRVYLVNGESIAAGQTKTFTFNIKAPSAAGTYNFQWQMVRENVQWFGQKTLNASIAVVAAFCVPNEIFGCKVCKADGSAWTDDNSKCAANQICSNGVCAAPSSCANDCSSNGLTQCNGNGYQACGNHDADSCLEWSSVTACASGQTCSAGVCAASTCANECSARGEGKCVGTTGYQTCGNWDLDDCLEWSDTLACGSGKICSSENGCVNQTCVNECLANGAKKCASESGYQICGNYDGDSCLEWSQIFNCSASQKCSAGVCAAPSSCANDCSPSGKIECSGSGYRACGNYDSDSCLEWSAVNSCAAGRTCKNGSCVLVQTQTRSQAQAETKTQTAAADKTAPQISQASPSGKIESLPVDLSVLTDEKSTCKYDIADTDYDSMENAFVADESGLSHNHQIASINAGNYTYYVRCKDAAGNKSASSIKIEFEYAAKPVQNGPTVFNISPAGTVYQNEAVLAAETDRPADCRYGSEDIDFAQMTNSLISGDGLSHQASIVLGEPGPYVYYLRCQEKAGGNVSDSTVLSFEYQKPDAQSAEPLEAPICQDYSSGEKDGACVNAADCVCDPDCALGGQDADPDCALLPADQKTSGSNWPLIAGAAGLIVVLILGLLFFLFKKGKKQNDFASEESEVGAL